MSPVAGHVEETRWPKGSAVVEYFGAAYELTDVQKRTDPFGQFRDGLACANCSPCSCSTYVGIVVAWDRPTEFAWMKVIVSYLKPLTPLAEEMIELARSGR